MRILSQTLALLCFLLVSAQAANLVDPPKQSPYFTVLTEGFSVDDFPLLATEVEAHIAGPIVDVTVRQSYCNDGTVPIEATYVFPGSTKAAVYAMEMRIGSRTITAHIKEKEEARRQYEVAKHQGKRSSLLEQDKPNVFTMNVANILPGEQVDLILTYNEFLVPESGQYSFVFPTVVGPRYAAGDIKPEFVSKTSYLPEGATVPYSVDISVYLQSPVPIQYVDSPTHKIRRTFQSAKGIAVRLSDHEKRNGNKDYILNYQLAEDEIVSGTLFYDHGDEKFFLSIIEAPKRVEPEMITPREFVFIVDVSGSMHGFPIETSKTLMRNLFKSMNDTDYFNVILFAGDSERLSDTPLQANQYNISRAMRILDQQKGGGGTELLRAIKKASTIPKPFVNTSRSLVIVTDGYIHVEEDCFDYIQEHLGEANVFAFGIGSGVNRYLIEGLAHVGRGESFVITERQFAAQQADKFKRYIESPVLTNISLSFNDFNTYDVIPRHIPDLLAERPIYVFGKYKGDVTGSISLEGHTGSGEYKVDIPLVKTETDKQNTALRYLWAREKLAYLSDYASLSHQEPYKSEITQIGLQYNLLSKYTSFLAIDEQIVTDGTQTKTVRQTLPLPKGVSNHAIGFEMGAEAVLKSSTKISDDVLYVSLSDDLAKEEAVAVEQFFQEKMSIVDQEAKDLLEGNALIVEVDVQDGIISIIDESDLLDEAQIKILENQLFGLAKLIKKSSTFKFTLLWL